MYEFATEDNQRYKEGRIILERALITEVDGIPDEPRGFNNPLPRRHNSAASSSHSSRLS